MEGEMIEIPFMGRESDFKQANCNLIRFLDEHNQTLESCFEKLEYIKSQGAADIGTIKLKGLQAGDYLLFFNQFKKSISIKIFPGAYWISEEFIVGETGIGLDIQKQPFVQIQDVKTDANTLKFKIKGAKDSQQI